MRRPRNIRALVAYHVMPLLPGHEAELAADASRLLELGVCTDIACKMTLVPEGDPPEEKAKILGERFSAFRRVFRGDPARLGILAQATLGHGWTPDEPAPYQKIIRPEGRAVYQMCPLDPAFQDYIQAAFGHLAALKPAFFMIDDDFRLLTGRNGCYCPLHRAEIGRRLGAEFTRETLLETLRRDAAAARAFDAVLLDSLMRLAGIIRDAIDGVNPSIPGSFCACYGDIRHAGPLARRLAGAGQPRVVRINNARYLTADLRTFPIRMYHGAAQIAGLAPDITVLAETDPCPHNRYSTGAYLMHAHYAGSILEGCHGAKHWLTRTRSYQPASGTAYREVLIRHHGFYETLFQAVQTSAPAGCVAAALPSEPAFNPAPDRGDDGGSGKTWGTLLGVMGLPCNFARMPDLPALMTGADVGLFADADLRRLLKSGLLLEGAAAEALVQRGWADEIGVRAEPWTGPQVSGERWGAVVLGPDGPYTRLTPLDARTQVHSQLVHRRSGVSGVFEEIGPAATLFQNAAGGRVVALAANCGWNNSLTGTGRSFYDEDRKRELVGWLEWIRGRPLEFYYPGDAEIYLKLRRFTDGRYLLAAFNLGFDPLDTLPLVTPFHITAAEMIQPDGAWAPVEVGSGPFLATPLLPAQPKVFRLAVES